MDLTTILYGKHKLNDKCCAEWSLEMGLQLPTFWSQMTQLVNSLSRPPRPMSPGRSALSAQLQQLAANRLAHTAAQQPEVPVFFGHDPIETGKKEKRYRLYCIHHNL